MTNTREIESADSTMLSASFKHTGKVDEAVISRWKEADKRAIPVEQGKVLEIMVDAGNDELAYAYFKYPSRDVMARALSLGAQDRVLEAGEVVLVNGWLGGDERLKPGHELTDEYLCMTAAMEAFNAIKLAKAFTAKY